LKIIIPLAVQKPGEYFFDLKEPIQSEKRHGGRCLSLSKPGRCKNYYRMIVQLVFATRSSHWNSNTRGFLGDPGLPQV